jgi:hypothetical protein
MKDRRLVGMSALSEVALSLVTQDEFQNGCVARLNQKIYQSKQML